MYRVIGERGSSQIVITPSRCYQGREDKKWLEKRQLICIRSLVGLEIPEHTNRNTVEDLVFIESKNALVIRGHD